MATLTIPDVPVVFVFAATLAVVGLLAPRVPAIAQPVALLAVASSRAPPSR